MKIHRLGPGSNAQSRAYKASDKPTTPPSRQICWYMGEVLRPKDPTLCAPLIGTLSMKLVDTPCCCQVDRSECAVRNCWEQWTREGTHAWKTGSGATRKTTRREDRRIVRQALVDPTETRSTIRADVGVATVLQTISRHLAEANLKSKRPFRALPLTPEHRQLRLQWCQARSMWNVTDWQKVVFSYESWFVLGTDDNRVRVLRRSVPFLNGLPGAIFHQDNARPHTARVAQDFLRHFQTLPRPARSLDLSPVEHVWDELKRQMPSCHSVHDLSKTERCKPLTSHGSVKSRPTVKPFEAQSPHVGVRAVLRHEQTGPRPRASSSVPP
ncbi:transposable element Tc1 transposase [Trichonephila clavipes]|nr:transposable element Tc1 transposase [Trichonephila clavipes]